MGRQITPQLLAALTVGFQKKFQDAIATTPVWHTGIAMVLPSKTRLETYFWLDRMPKLRQWIGPRVVHNVAARAKAVENKKYEHTVGVSRDSIEDDQFGLYNPIFELQGAQVAKHPDQLLAELLESNGGVGPIGYDDKPVFDNAHPQNLEEPTKGVNDNLMTSKLSVDSYWEARQKMRDFRGADGQPLAVLPDTLVVPTSLEKMGKDILEADRNALGATNTAQGTSRLLVIPELTDPEAWYLMVTGMPIKPFAYQTRTAPEFQRHFDPNSAEVFKMDEYQFGVRVRGAVTETVYWMALKSKP